MPDVRTPAKNMATVGELTAALEASSVEFSRVLRSVADRQDYRPDSEHWSFREIAAHMEATQVECIYVRIRQIGANANPTFEFYRNDGWDFSDRDIRDSIRGFNDARRRMIEFARSCGAAQLTRTGEHKTFGRITVADYLRIDLHHDREHLADLGQMIERLGARR